MTTRQIPKYSIVMVINRVVFLTTRIRAKPTKLKAEHSDFWATKPKKSIKL